MGAINKKGIFFTLIAITVMAMFILVFTPQADISLQKDNQAIRTRISSVDNYVDDLENRYFETVLRAATHKTTLSLIFYMNSTGSFLTNVDSAFSEVMLTGKINGVPIDSVTGKKIMENNTLLNWSNSIIQAAKDTLNANTNISIHNVSVFQTGPWTIESRLILNFTVNSSIASWKKENVTITASISIEGLHDPYYLVNTNKAYTNQIKRSSVKFNKWNTAEVREHLRNGTYVHWENSDAPSFLMRFTNTIEPSSCCGIESLVNPNKITPSDQLRSYVDYHFWRNDVPCSGLYDVTSLWDEFNHFRLDFDHITKYNIQEGDVIKTVCPS